MEIDYSKIEIICRCCLTEHGKMKNMFVETLKSEKHSKIHLIDGYKTCLDLQLNNFKPDLICKNICEKCRKKLQISIEFRDQCQVSYRILEEKCNLVDGVKEELNTSDVEDTDIVYNDCPLENSEQKPNQFTHQVFLVKELQETGRKSVEVNTDELTENLVQTVSIDPKDIEENIPQSEDDNIHMDSDSFQSDNEENKKVPFQKVEMKTTVQESENIDALLLEGNFSCPICDLVLNNLRDHKAHRKIHLWDSGLKFVKRVCNLCKKHTDSYLYHIKKEHPEYKPNSCRTCGNSYQQPSALQSHLLSHLDIKAFDCKACGEKFCNTHRLKFHLAKVKHSSENYQCRECGLLCKTFTEFLEHFKVHYEETILRRFYPCYVCKNIFLRRWQAQKHNCDPEISTTAANLSVAELKKTLGKDLKKLKGKKKQEKSKMGMNGKEKLHVCSRCSESFSVEDELVCHQYSWCAEKVRYICTPCGKEFRTSTLLISHNRNNHEERKFVCDECGTKWATEQKLKLHKIVHMTSRTFKCEPCNVSFKNMTAWKVHQVVHEERRFECNHCVRKFRSLKTIARHMVRHQETPALHKCDYCDKTFKLLVDKRCHTRIHTRDTFNCGSCGKEYRSGNALKHHINLVHKGIRYDCNVCSQSLSSRRQLYDHMFLHRGFRPYQCTSTGCSRQFLMRDRFKRHLREHNIEYDEKQHGYIEKDANIFKTVDSCMISSADKMKSKTATVTVSATPCLLSALQSTSAVSTMQFGVENADNMQLDPMMSQYSSF